MTEQDSPRLAPDWEGRRTDPGESDATRAMDLLAVNTSTRSCSGDWPAERDITDEPVRIGVFVCHCGSEIARVVNIAEVTSAARQLSEVAWVSDQRRLCDAATQRLLVRQIVDHRLNRVVIASGTPRTHESLFGDLLHAAGLNRYLLELVNIRSHCAWVHMHEPELATAKANDLIRMGVSRAACLVPLEDRRVPVTRAALVVGGTLAGMTAALSIARAGYLVHLVERRDRLGSSRLQSASQAEARAAHALEQQTIEEVHSYARIKVHLRSEVVRIDGLVGSFTSQLRCGSTDTSVAHGVIVVDVNAAEHAAIALHSDGLCPKAHTRLQPTELASDGLFSCGSAGTAQLAETTLAESQMVGLQALSVLSRKDTSVGVQPAQVDSSRCVSCMTCIHICPQHAPRADEKGKSRIEAGLCVGCGTCVADCPACAITLPHHTDQQLRAALDGLLGTDAPNWTRQAPHPEQPGVAQLHWRRRGVVR